VNGYQLPKWRAEIDLNIDVDVQARIAASGGVPDLTLSASLPPLRDVIPQSRMGTTTMIHRVDGVIRPRCNPIRCHSRKAPFRVISRYPVMAAICEMPFGSSEGYPKQTGFVMMNKTRTCDRR
jgi:hypothetical protein